MQPRAAATRDAIVVAAAQIFAEVGYADTSLRLVCSRAGVTNGALYFHFSNKEHLATTVLRRYVAEMSAFCDSLLQRPTSAPETMVFASFAWTRRIRSDPLVAGGVRLCLERPDLLPAPEDAYRAWHLTTERLLLRARHTGVVDDRLDVQPAARFLIDAYVGAQIVSRDLCGHRDLEQRIIELWRCSFTGLLEPGVGTGVDLLVDRALSHITES